MYKNLFVLPNIRPYTKHKKRIIPAIITGRISSSFLLLYHTPNSLCWLDGGPPTKTLCQKLGVLQKVGGPDPPPPTHLWLRPCPLHLECNWEKNMWHSADCEVTQSVCKVKQLNETFLLRSSVSNLWRQLVRSSAALREATSCNSCCCSCDTLATVTSLHRRTSFDDVTLSANTCL